MSDHIHGTCGNCGGLVVTPKFWMGIYPSSPTCNSCGANPKSNVRKVIPMKSLPKENFIYSK